MPRSSSWAGSGGWRRTPVPRTPGPAPATVSCARSRTGPSTSSPGWSSPPRLNVAVARLMELASATRRAIDSGPGAADPAVREAAETLAVLLSIFAPYTAEECWELLGHQPSVALAGWPSADPALLVEDLVTCVVQVNGKVRDRLEVPPGIGEDELRETGAGRPRRGPGAGRRRGQDGHRARAAPGQHRPRLTARCSSRPPPSRPRGPSRPHQHRRPCHPSLTGAPLSQRPRVRAQRRANPAGAVSA